MAMKQGILKTTENSNTATFGKGNENILCPKPCRKSINPALPAYFPNASNLFP